MRTAKGGLAMAQPLAMCKGQRAEARRKLEQAERATAWLQSRAQERERDLAALDSRGREAERARGRGAGSGGVGAGRSFSMQYC